jgi:hypothetical protein
MAGIAAFAASVADDEDNRFPHEYVHEIAEEDKIDRADGKFPRPWQLSGRALGREIIDANGNTVGWMHPASLAAATVKSANHYGTHIINIPDEDYQMVRNSVIQETQRQNPSLDS